MNDVRSFAQCPVDSAGTSRVKTRRLQRTLGCGVFTAILGLSSTLADASAAASDDRPFGVDRQQLPKSDVDGDNVAIASSLHRPAVDLESRTAIAAATIRKLHPKWRDLSAAQKLQRFEMFATRFFRGATSSAKAATAQPQLANFSGNLTAITASSSEALYLQRQADCSLKLNTGNYTYSYGSLPTISVITSTSNYQNTLHAAAQLTSKDDVFANGCIEATGGIGSRRGMYLGKTSQNLYMFASAGYYSPSGTNGLYYGTVDATTTAVHAFTTDTTQPNINQLAAGDLNGDGVADVVGLDQFGTSASMSVRIAHTDGTLSALTSYALAGSIAEAAVVGDFNGDGKADVIVISRDTNTQQEYLNVLTGKGDGSLNAAASSKIATPTYTTSYGGVAAATIVNILASDLRGSGRKDVVASNGLVLLNNGDGTFAAASQAAFTPRSATSDYGPNLAAGDLNADKKTDLVVNNGAQIDIYVGNGDGTFRAGASYATISSVGYVTITDLDGDGNADVYVGLANGGFFAGDQFGVGQAYALMGNGDGTLRGAAASPAAYNGQNMADLNGDNKLDMVAANGSALTTYFGRSDGTFSQGTTLNVPTFSSGGKNYTYSAIASYALADVNGDGRPDLVWIPQGTLDVSTARSFYLVALNKGDGSFSAPKVFEFPTLAKGSDFETYFAVGAVQAADFNHDGKADLIFSFSESTYTGTSYQLGYFVLLSKGDGTFAAPVTLISATASLGSFSPPAPPLAPAAITDVNGDPNPDLLVVQDTGPLPAGGGRGSQLALYLGKGDGSFSTAAIVPAAPNPFTAAGFVVAADMNGDGHPDIVSLGQAEADGNGYLSISLGKGDGSFATPKTYILSAQGITFDGLAVADFDGDGKPDVALANFEVPGGILAGNGDGTLATPNTDGGGNILPTQQLLLQGGQSTTAVDVNGDGVPDIVSGNVVLLNQRSGSSTSGPTVLNLDQHGLTGAWYDAATGGQGFIVEVYPDIIGSGQAVLAAGWYTFDTTAAGGQRWYTLQGPATKGATSAVLGIYSSSGGNFDALPTIKSTQVGTATISFSDCTHASLSYDFSDGSGRSGTIALTRLDANITCAEAGDSGNAASNYLLSGAWFNATTSGQGFFFDVNPAQTLFFGAWYTYTPNGSATGGGASQRWYTIQDNSFATGTTSKSGLAIYTTSGGTFNSSGGTSTTQVGTASITFQSCGSATLGYNFTSGTNAGKSGTINLSRVVGAPAGCSL